MPSKAAPVNSAVARIAALKRHNGDDDPRLPHAERDLRYAKLRQEIERQVAAWPPLTGYQRSQLASLLRHGLDSVGGDR